MTSSAVLPDPVPYTRTYPVISVDDHIHEPPDVFVGRLPSALQDRAPAHTTDAAGNEYWAYEGKVYSSIGMEDVSGRDPATWNRASLPRSELRPGTWEIDGRVTDMDLDGVYAQIVFPSGIFGFAGRMIVASQDSELGLATLRAYNDWHLEYLAQTHPGRIIPMQLVWFTDPQIAARDIRMNAARGFKAASLPDLPQHLGLPRVGDPYWNPIFEALEETETVVCTHLGAAGWTLDAVPNRGLASEPGESPEVTDFTRGALFPGSSFVTGVEWTTSGIPHRFPGLRVALSEGGIGWVPMAIDRLEYMQSRRGEGMMQHWKSDLSPAETLASFFYFCMIDNPSNLDVYKRVGSDHIMVETDYPHSDSTWPDTQKLLTERFADLPVDDALNMAYRTAATVFRHPVPEEWLQTTAIH